MQPCSSPPSVTNGFFVIAKGSYSNGDQISYYCKMGYELTGTATRSCDGATGAWSGSTPKCTAATTIASVTTTTESPSQITVAALVLVPMVILLLVLLSAVTVYAMKYLHCQNGCKVARKYVLREIVKQTCGDQQMADPGCQKMPKCRPRTKCFLLLCGVPLWDREMMIIGDQI
uniref:Seizure 6-like protein 2 n=1 Tax=Magallana gigas TaxID=29159 RepID=K1R248_MAGGI